MAFTSLLEVLNYLKESQANLQNCETMIVCKDGQFHCNSLIMTVISPPWRKILNFNGQNDDIWLLVPDVEVIYVQQIFSLLFDGKVTIPKSEKDDFHKVFRTLFPDISIKTGNLKSNEKPLEKNVDFKNL